MPDELTDELPACVADLLERGTRSAVHVTSAAVADQLDDGLDGGALRVADGSRSGTVLWGAGVYVALDEPTAALWRDEGSVDLDVTVTLDAAYVHDYDSYGGASARVRDWSRIAATVAASLDEAATARGGSFPEQLAARARRVVLPGEASRAEHAADSPSLLRPGLLGHALVAVTRREAWAHAEGVDVDAVTSARQLPWNAPGWRDRLPAAAQAGYTAMLREAGHDGLIVVERVPTRHAGGNQVCVFDPAAVHVEGTRDR